MQSTPQVRSLPFDGACGEPRPGYGCGVLTPYRQILDTLQPIGEGRWRGATTPDWLQGRSLFGGLQVAFALRAMRSLVALELPLRSLQVTFLAPVPPGAVEVEAKVLRAGKNVIQAEGRIVSGAQTLALVLGIFGAARSSVISVVPPGPERISGSSETLAQIPGATPAFLEHFRMCWLRGRPPFTQTPERTAVIEVDLRDEGRASELHLPAIADSIPPVALSMLAAPTPGSSMTWMLELLQESYDGLPLAGWRFDVEVTAAAHGYTSQSALLWTPDGRPAALSRQNMVVFG